MHSMALKPTRFRYAPIQGQARQPAHRFSGCRCGNGALAECARLRLRPPSLDRGRPRAGHRARARADRDFRMTPPTVPGERH